MSSNNGPYHRKRLKTDKNDLRLTAFGFTRIKSSQIEITQETENHENADISDLVDSYNLICELYS